jgi:hypothetical protein
VVARARSSAAASIDSQRRSTSSAGTPISDCGADCRPMRRMKASFTISMSPSAFSIIAATGEASASASRRAVST